MKQLCVDARMAFHSGIGTYIRNLLPHLNAAFPRLKVFAPEAFIERWPELSGFDLIPTSAPIYSLREQAEIPFKVSDCDIFWSPHYNVPLIPIRAKRRVVTIHDVYHLVYRHTLPLHKRLYAKIMLNNAVRLSDQIMTVSHFSKDEIVRMTGASPGKIAVIHNGVGNEFFHRAGSIELPENYFLFIGNLAPHKNLGRVLEAWKKVVDAFPDWHLVVVGKQKSALEKVTNVSYKGEIKNDILPSVYQKAYALLAPSLYEGFGLTPIEAMAAGCPAIVSNCASFPEVCGDAAIYVNPLDIEGIVLQIKSLITNQALRKSLIQKGYEKAKQLSWEKSANEYIALYNHLFK